jgi:hypothetical protein
MSGKPPGVLYLVQIRVPPLEGTSVTLPVTSSLITPIVSCQSAEGARG